MTIYNDINERGPSSASTNKESSDPIKLNSRIKNSSNVGPSKGRINLDTNTEKEFLNNNVTIIVDSTSITNDKSTESNRLGFGDLSNNAIRDSDIQIGHNKSLTQFGAGMKINSFQNNNQAQKLRDQGNGLIYFGNRSTENLDMNSKVRREGKIQDNDILKQFQKPLASKMVLKSSRENLKIPCADDGWERTASNYDNIEATSTNPSTIDAKDQRARYANNPSKKKNEAYGDLRTYGPIKTSGDNSNRSSATMSYITEEDENFLYKSSDCNFSGMSRISRSRSVEGDTSTSGGVDYYQKRGLWTEREMYTDGENSEAEENLSDSDYVLDSTAYVCAIIDTLGLSEEERSAILMVVARDERLRLKEKQRIL